MPSVMSGTRPRASTTRPIGSASAARTADGTASTTPTPVAPSPSSPDSAGSVGMMMMPKPELRDELRDSAQEQKLAPQLQRHG